MSAKPRVVAAQRVGDGVFTDEGLHAVDESSGEGTDDSVVGRWAVDRTNEREPEGALRAGIEARKTSSARSSSDSRLAARWPPRLPRPMNP